MRLGVPVLVLAACSGTMTTARVAPAPDGPDAALADAPAVATDGTPADAPPAASDAALADAPPAAPDATPPSPDAADPCNPLSPAASAAANRTAIQACLDGGGQAVLGPGVYPVDRAIDVPAGAQLLGQGPGRPIVRRAAGAAGNTLVSLSATGGRLAGLDLDGNNVWPGTCCDAVVALGGSGNVVEDATIRNASAPPAGVKSTGVYFIGEGASANVVRRCDIHQLFYGVIFRSGYAPASANTVEESHVHDNQCDGVTFAGYGRVTTSVLERNGYDCENGPIPGASFYAAANPNGGLIQGNTIRNNCGNNIDLVSSRGFQILGNTVELPGWDWAGARPYCSGGFSVQLAGVTDSTVRGNTITNDGRAANRVGLNPNTVWFRASGAAAFSDVPGGSTGVIAFILATDPTNGRSTGNTIDDNVLRASCTGGCLGIGYFATRGTGYDSAGDWKPSFFTGNRPFGSQVGSKRCGGNWYAGNDTCTDGSPAPCNGDDYQHNPPAGDAFRNDGCNFY